MALEGGVVLAQSSEDKAQADAKAHDKMGQKAIVKKTAPPVKSTPAPNPTQPLALTVTTDKKTYAAGTVIQMTLTAKNTTAAPMNLNFNSGQQYDFALREGTKPDGKIVWQWAKGRMFAQMMGNKKLEPGKSLTFTETYDPKALPATSEALKAGTYTLTATLATFGTRPFASTQVTIK